jgi:ATP-dependent DNA helicase Rep
LSLPLNAPQREAVRYCAGPLLVVAGAGSGKTRVIAAKIVHLVAQGMDPAQIVAITFTNKAAREMRERARTQLAAAGKNAAAAKLTVATFHAFGLAIMRGEASALGLARRFSVLDPSDLEATVAELIGTADRGRAREAQRRISTWKNALIPPAAALADAQDDDELVAARAYANYAEALAAYQAVDFDDLILRPLTLLEGDPAAAARWRRRIAHLLIDEYQDTNPAQYRLLRALVGEATPFTAVGDDDQAIYGWRGATLDNLAALQRDYPKLKVVPLEQNYRSTVRILRSANTLIGHNPKLFDKRLWSDLGHGDAIPVAPAADEEAEALLVLRRIDALRFERRASYSDFAILYRGNHQARVFETVLRAQSIPYEISGGQSLFDRTEIKDIVAYLRLILNDADDPAFLRAIAAPRRGVGNATLARLGETAAARKESLFAAIFAEPSGGRMPALQRQALDAFGALINNLRFRAPREPAGRLLDELVTAIGSEAWLVDTLDKRDAQTRCRNVRDFIGWFARKGEAENRNLLDLAQALALAALADDRDEAPDAIRLSTLHAAKGLEFPHVFLVGLEEGILPHRTAIDAGNVDEERRLMYVGVTRAQRTLHLSWCRSRNRAGAAAAGIPSRFIGELAQDDLRYADAPLTPAGAQEERAAGRERLQALKALLGNRDQESGNR